MQYLFLLLPIYGLLVSRFHGGGFYGGFSKTIKNLMWAVPFALAAGLLGEWWLGLVALPLCLFGKATGHGGWMDLGTWTKPRSDERIEFIIKPLRDKMPVYWYDVLGMALVGFAAVSGAVIAFAFINPLSASIIALGGLFKAVAYMIGWWIFPEYRGIGPEDFDTSTEIGEALTGFFAYAGLAAALWLTL